VYYKKGDLVEADTYLRQAWEVAQMSDIGEHLAQVFEAKGRQADAISLYRLSVAAAKGSSDRSIRRLRVLGGGAIDEATIKTAEQAALISLRTVQLPQRVAERASAEFLLLVDGGGRILDARFLRAIARSRREPHNWSACRARSRRRRVHSSGWCGARRFPACPGRSVRVCCICGGTFAQSSSGSRRRGWTTSAALMRSAKCQVE
jgi:hypothetical protein